jgi:hypothetical protein
MSSFVIANPIETGSGPIWQVFCHRCAADLGTMAGDVVARAVLATKDRGGVLCPQCREKACRHCGTPLRGDELEAEVTLCGLCAWEMMMQDMLV